MHEFGQFGGDKGFRAREQLVEDHPNREEVGPDVGGPSEETFRGHIIRRAHCPQPVGIGQFERVEAGHAEIGDFDRSGRGTKDIGGLDVAVDHALGMGVIQRQQDLRHDFPNLPDGDERAGLDHVLKRAGVDVFHHDIGTPLLLHEVEHGDDIRVQAARRRLRLGDEALEEALRIVDFVEESPNAGS